MNLIRSIKHNLVIVLAIVLILISSGCGRPPEIYDPFKVPRQEFYPQLGRIAIVPMKFNSEFSEFDNAITVLDSLLAKELREDEIEVIIVTIEKSDSLQGAFMKDIGGFFNPYTGKLDKEKTKKWRRMLIREMEEKYNVDAVMFSSIRKVTAHFSSDRAKWDGASESVGKDRFLKTIMGISHSGDISALSLIVELREVNDSLLYLNAGGIQVLKKIGAFGGPEDRPSEEILSNVNRMRDAVRYAINPLLGIVERKRPGSTKKPKTRSTLMESE